MISDLLDGIGVEMSGLLSGVEERVWGGVRRLPFGQWCEENIIITPGENADFAGPYDRSLTPSAARFWEEFLDADDGEKWSEMYAAKGSQSAFTLHALAAMVRQVEYDPGNMVYAMDSQKSAADVAERFVWLLEEAPGLQSLMATLSDDETKGLKIELGRLSAWFVGAGSVGDMASKPGVKFVVGDEVEKHRTPKREAQTLDLLADRKKATVAAKGCGFSTPTDELGQIWRFVQSGSGHRDFVPCPHCGHMQFLRLDQVRYDHLVDRWGALDLNLVREKAEYECEDCGRGISERMKREMFKFGEVRPTNYEERDGVQVPKWFPRRMSVYHNDLYAMWSGSRWGDLAAEKAEAGKDPIKLRKLVNGRLGEAWKLGIGKKVRLSDILTMRADYPRGSVPVKPVLVGGYIDTQDDCFKCCKVGYTEKGDFMVSDFETFLLWKDAVEWMKKGVAFEGVFYPVQVNLTDEGGHRTWEVRQNCLKLYPVFNPSKGTGGIKGGHSTVWREYYVDKDSGDAGEKVSVLRYADDGFKWFLYHRLILENAAVVNGDHDHGRLSFPRDLRGEEAMEFTREFLTERAGVATWNTPKGNDLADCVKLALIGWGVFGHLVRGSEVVVPGPDFKIGEEIEGGEEIKEKR